MKSPHTTNIIYMGCIILLVFLWSYTALSKLVDPNEFIYQMYAQKFNRSLTTLLIYSLPYIELLLALTFLSNKTIPVAWMGSTLLMFLFTLYMGLVYGGYYQRIPCACGGVIKTFSFKGHFYFNFSFLIISLLGTMIHFKSLKRRSFQ